MLTLQWLLAGAAFVVAVVAWMRVRRLGRRLERLTESYWDLRYEYGQLRARVAKLEPQSAADIAEPVQQAPAGSFIPLSSLKR